MPIVKLPDGRSIKFPDTMTAEQIEATIKDVLQAEGAEAQPQAPQAQVAPQPTQAPQEEPGLLDQALGGLETAGTIASGILAEPIAGISGLAKSITSGPEEATRTIEGIRQALTFQPRTEAGQEQLAAVGGALEPVAKAFTGAEKTLGDTAFNITGSPEIAALAASIPGIILELPALKGIKVASKPTKVTKQARKAVEEVAPAPELLKESAGKIYKEIDNSGAVIKPDAMNKLLDDMRKSANEVNMNEFTTQESFGLMGDFVKKLEGQAVDIKTLRNAQGKAKTLLSNPKGAEQVVGGAMVDTIDAFIDSAGKGAIDFGVDAPKNMGMRLRAANELWGRAKKAEEIQNIFFAAELADNADLALKNGFKSLLKNKKKMRFFNAEDKAAMRAVVKGEKGTKGFSLMDFLGKAGIDATSYFRAGLMGTLATMTLGPRAGGAAVAFSTLSKDMAKRLRLKNAKFGDAVIRAGKDADKVMQAYIQNTPKKLRSVEDMADLLARPTVDIERLSIRSQFAETAKRLAISKRTETTLRAAPGAVASGLEREELNVGP